MGTKFLSTRCSQWLWSFQCDVSLLSFRKWHLDILHCLQRICFFILLKFDLHVWQGAHWPDCLPLLK